MHIFSLALEAAPCGWSSPLPFGRRPDRGIKQPVLPLRKALYGLQRSGFDWAKKANKVLSNLGWQLVPDVVDAVYVLREGKSMCIMALYVDDILAAGPGPTLVKSLNAIRGV